MMLFSGRKNLTILEKLVLLYSTKSFMSDSSYMKSALFSLSPPLITRKLFGDQDFVFLWGIENVGLNIGKMAGTPLFGLEYDMTGSYTAGFHLFIAAAIAAGAALFAAMHFSKDKAGSTLQPGYARSNKKRVSAR